MDWFVSRNNITISWIASHSLAMTKKFLQNPYGGWSGTLHRNDRKNTCVDWSASFLVILRLEWAERIQLMMARRRTGKSFIRKFRGSDVRMSGYLRRAEPANKILSYEAPKQFAFRASWLLSAIIACLTSGLLIISQVGTLCLSHPTTLPQERVYFILNTGYEWNVCIQVKIKIFYTD